VDSEIFWIDKNHYIVAEQEIIRTYKAKTPGVSDRRVDKQEYALQYEEIVPTKTIVCLGSKRIGLMDNEKGNVDIFEVDSDYEITYIKTTKPD